MERKRGSQGREAGSPSSAHLEWEENEETKAMNSSRKGDWSLEKTVRIGLWRLTIPEKRVENAYATIPNHPSSSGRAATGCSWRSVNCLGMMIVYRFVCTGHLLSRVEMGCAKKFTKNVPNYSCKFFSRGSLNGLLTIRYLHAKMDWRHRETVLSGCLTSIIAGSPCSYIV
ncbi:hypothetical protein SCHPADRAFT_391784 [Schizopora paradoxa]|uniref:Uncharacterized protein n=1 Tax=Schizopora paradoxa TaxID=27342 RepID=A0A0H2RU41_9AGAM|nr:hypothetical protein SCHPADRAFT_391784 [Schizopora paradoxa]